jgi:hypothetical protein
MKMIGHQTIGKYFAMREHKTPEKLEKLYVILIRFEDGLPVVSLIINVIHFISNNIHGSYFKGLVFNF